MVFEEDIEDSIFDSCLRSSEDDGMTLVHAAKIIRREIFQEFKPTCGSFDRESGKVCTKMLVKFDYNDIARDKYHHRVFRER